MRIVNDEGSSSDTKEDLESMHDWQRRQEALRRIYVNTVRIEHPSDAVPQDNDTQVSDDKVD